MCNYHNVIVFLKGRNDTMSFVWGTFDNLFTSLVVKLGSEVGDAFLSFQNSCIYHPILPPKSFVIAKVGIPLFTQITASEKKEFFSLFH